MCYCPTPTLHLNLALTGDGAFLFSLKNTHSVWFISVLNYGDTENVLINHLLLVIPMSYPCHYTNLCPHKPHKHAHTHTHTHTHKTSPLLLPWKQLRCIPVAAGNGLPGRRVLSASVERQSQSWCLKRVAYATLLCRMIGCGQKDTQMLSHDWRFYEYRIWDRCFIETAHTCSFLQCSLMHLM